MDLVVGVSNAAGLAGLSDADFDALNKALVKECIPRGTCILTQVRHL